MRRLLGAIEGCDCCDYKGDEVYWVHLDGFDPEARYELNVFLCENCVAPGEARKEFERIIRAEAREKAHARWLKRHAGASQE